MRQEYLDELKALEEKMQKAEKFAEKLPVFSEQILRQKLTGGEDWMKYSERYKKIPLIWGINRGFYRHDSNRYVMNYPKDKEYSLHLFNVYINSVSLFNTHQEFGLYQYLKDVDIFFADEMNTTFYVTDENIEAFLEALNTWYGDATEKLKKHRLQEQEAELKKKLEETQNQLKGAA